MLVFTKIIFHHFNDKKNIILYKNKIIIILNSMKHIFMQNQQNSKRIHQIKEKLKLQNIQSKIL